MAECIVCGEKIEDGQQYCSVCAPEHHEKKEETVVAEPNLAEENLQEEAESKIEIKKGSIIPENSTEDDIEDPDEEDNG